MKKVYSKELGMSVYVDPVTREQIGGGLFDSIFSAAAKQTAKQTAKQLATETRKKSASAALDTGSKKLGEKVGQYVAEKTAPRPKDKGRSPTKIPVTPVTKPGALIKEIKKYSRSSAPRDTASEVGKILGKGKKKKKIKAFAQGRNPKDKVQRRINRLL